MTFKLRSGNKTVFKNMGNSPLKASTNYSDKAQNLLKAVPNKDAYNKLSSIDKQGFDKAAEKYGLPTKKESPAKQKLNKGGEAQDQDKIFNNKGEHVGNYVNGKKVMIPKKSTVTAHGQLDDAEIEYQEDIKGVTSNIKMPKVMKDGPKTNVHGIDLGKDPHWQPYRAKKKKSPAKQTDSTYADGSKKSKREQDFSKRHTAEKATYDTSAKDHAKQDPYWYKVDGKKVSKHIYIKYKNKPGNMEGGGKQTNNPDVYGKKASNFGRGPKTK